MAAATSWVVPGSAGAAPDAATAQSGAAGNPTLDMDDAMFPVLAHMTEGLGMLTGGTYTSFESVEVERPAAGTRVNALRLGSIVVGRYNGIVLTQADLYTPSGSGFTAEEWEALHAYEREFAVREAVVAGFPIFAPAPSYATFFSGG